jgi:hypothetical protein
VLVVGEGKPPIRAVNVVPVMRSRSGNQLGKAIAGTETLEVVVVTVDDERGSAVQSVPERGHVFLITCEPALRSGRCQNASAQVPCPRRSTDSSQRTCSDERSCGASLFRLMTRHPPMRNRYQGGVGAPVCLCQ